MLLFPSQSIHHKEYRSMGINKKGGCVTILCRCLSFFALASMMTLTLNAYAFAAPVNVASQKARSQKQTQLDLFPKSSHQLIQGKTPPIQVASLVDYSTVPVPLHANDRLMSAARTVARFTGSRLPGLALTALLAQAATMMSKYPVRGVGHISPLLWATVIGMIVGNLTDYHHKGETRDSSVTQAILGTGIKFCKARLLRLGIILYGFKVTLSQIVGIGWSGLFLDAFVVATTLPLGIRLGTSRWFGLDRATSTLIGSGSAICGCSAVLATQPVVDAKSHQVSAAVATVVLGGTASMFLYPLLYRTLPFLSNSPHIMGTFTGSTMHEIAGVVGAGTAMGPDVASMALVTKLARVMLLAPVLTILSWVKNHRKSEECQNSNEKCQITLPWFALGFVAVSALHSTISFPTTLVHHTSQASAFFLLCAMAGLGLDSNIQEIRKLGPKPLFLAATLWAWLVGSGLMMARFVL